jgi:hypothetical protein
MSNGSVKSKIEESYLSNKSIAKRDLAFLQGTKILEFKGVTSNTFLSDTTYKQMELCHSPLTRTARSKPDPGTLHL